MFRPFCIALIAGLIAAGAIGAANAEEAPASPVSIENPYFHHMMQRAHLEALRAKHCLVQSGWAREADRVGMLAALASYTSPNKRDGVRNITDIRFLDNADRWPRPRPETGLPWAYLQRVYTAASVGTADADADPGFISELTDLLVMQEARLDRRLYSRYGGAAAGMSLEADVLLQLYTAQMDGSQEMLAELCAAMSTRDRARHITRLSAASARFDRVMIAIVEGAAKRGVQPPPTDSIRTELEDAAIAWARVRELSKQARAGQDIEPEDVLKFARAMDTVRSHMGVARTLLLGGGAGSQ